jgi:prevent-host-death family protein
MPEIGVRELKTRASEIVRAVRDRRARYIVTYRGRPVGVLAPVEMVPHAEALPGGEPGTTVWEELTQLGEEIGRGWQSPLTGAELLSQMRR